MAIGSPGEKEKERERERQMKDLHNFYPADAQTSGERSYEKWTSPRSLANSLSVNSAAMRRTHSIGQKGTTRNRAQGQRIWKRHWKAEKDI